MKIYTIDSVNPLLGNYESYKVLCGFEDQTGRYGAIAIMTNEELSQKVQSWPLYDQTKYTRVDIDGSPYIIPEIILKECDANFLAENPDVQIEHLEHDGTMQGIGALLSSRADVADIVKQMLMPISGHDFKVVPVYRKDFLYLLRLNGEDAFEVVGYNMNGDIKNLGALSFDSSALRFLESHNISYCGHLKLSEDKTGVTVIPVVSLADVTRNVEYFHIIPISEDDEDYKYFTSSAVSFELTNVIHESNLSCLKKFNTFTQTSDSMAIDLIKTWKCDKIYTASIKNQTYILGVSRNGVDVTLKDIVHLKSAYLFMISILRCKDTDVRVIFGSVDDKPTIKIPYVINSTLQENIRQGDVSVIDVTQMPIGDLRESLLADYKEVCESGISVADLTKLEAGGTGAEEALKALCYTFDENVDSVEQFTLYDHFYEAEDSGSDRRAYDKAIKNLININKTVEQSECTSTFNRELPTLEQLLLIFGSNVTSDKFDLVENTDIFSNENVVDDDEDTENEEDTDPCYGDLEMSIDLAHMPLNAKPMSTTGISGVGKYFDSVCYKDIYKLVGSSEMASPECIEGNNANNMLPIQSNEVMFYAGLRRLVLEGLCLENNLYTIADLKATLVAGKRSRIVDAFLVCLAKDIFSLNWRHTGGVQVLQSELTDPRDLELYVKKSTARTNMNAEDFQGADTYICLGEYTVVKNAGEYTVVHKNLSTEPQDYFGSYTKGFVNGSANSLAWVEAVIRLARWNSRKPAMLWIPCKRDSRQSTENEQFLSLQTFTIQTWCGVFDSTKKIYFTDPFDSNAKSEFILHSRISSSLDSGTTIPNLSEFLNHYKLPDLERKGAELIYGVALDSFYENTDAIHTSYIDIFTFEKAVAEKHLTVFGLRFNETTQKFEETDGEINLGDGEFNVDPTSYFYDLYDKDHPECKSLKEVIARVTENCTENTVMPSAHVMQWTQFLKTLLPGDVTTLGKSEESANSDKSKDTGIFDILNLFGIFSSRNLQCCANATTDSDAQATLTATFKKPETILKALIFEKVAVSYLRLAIDIQKFVKDNGQQPKISEILTMARLIHQTENSFRSNIVNTQCSTDIEDVFISKYNACQHFYSFTATVGDSSATIYLGEEKLGNQSKYIFWEDKDTAELESRIGRSVASDITSLSIKEFTTVITPYWNKLREIQKKINLQTSLAELRSMKRDTFVSYKDSANSIKDTLSVFLASKWQPAYRAFIEASKVKS